MHLTCTIPRDWSFLADLKLSSQGWWPVGMIWSGNLLWGWWLIWLPDCRDCFFRFWGWSDVVLGYGCLIWGRSDWLLWRSGLVWWPYMEVCLRKMVWSECWKLKRWEAELIVVNGSIREKRDSCIRKVGEKNRAQGSMEKNSHSFKTRITHSFEFLSRIPCPSHPSRLLFSRVPTPYPPHKMLCTFLFRS